MNGNEVRQRFTDLLIEDREAIIEWLTDEAAGRGVPVAEFTPFPVEWQAAAAEFTFNSLQGFLGWYVVEAAEPGGWKRRIGVLPPPWRGDTR